jgi:hypothetical protein
VSGEGIGRSWDPGKAHAMAELLYRVGRGLQGRSKGSVPRVAAKAGVSKEFVRSLKAYEAGATVRANKDGETVATSRGWTNRETSKVLAVLEACGVTPEEFLRRAGRR